MKTFILQTEYPYIDRPQGWGNGYVLLPKEHPFYGKSYKDIPVNVYGGLTFSSKVTIGMIENLPEYFDLEDEGKWCVGFDTGHFNSNPIDHSEEFVLKETESLKNQLIALTN